MHLQHFESYVRYQILREPSAKVPQRRLKQLIKKGSEQVCTEANCMADEDRRGSTVSRWAISWASKGNLQSTWQPSEEFYNKVTGKAIQGSVTQCCCVRRNVSHQYSSFGNPQQNVLRRFVLPHLVSSTQEVIIVFDSPQPHSQSPKAFEQKWRDVTNALPSDHKHTHFTNYMAVQTKLRENLSCRTCKRQLVE